MTESLSSVAKKAGLPPGTLIHVGETRETETTISVIDYNLEKMEETTIDSVEQILPYLEKETITWINIEGLGNIELIEGLGKHFGIHPLVLEDILNTHQRPKLEEYDDYLYLVLKGLTLAPGALAIEHEQISLLLMDRFVFTFKEKRDDLFQPIRTRLRNSKGFFRSMGADYLAYVILDTIVDDYFALQDSLDEIIDSVDEELLSNPGPDTLGRIQGIKRELIYQRRAIAPLRELLNALLRSESPLVLDKTKIYLRDVHDHILRVSEASESQRDLVSSQFDIYMSSLSNRMNEVMKVLTVFASIFIPLTFIAGIYGMNFHYMPELEIRWAYPALWTVFVLIVIALLLYFKKKKWL